MWDQLHQLATPLSPSEPADLPSKVEAPIPPLPITPPEPIGLQDHEANSFSVSSALHVISTQRKAVEHLEQVYQHNEIAQSNFTKTVSLIYSATEAGGQVVFIGVGKSGKICKKLKATFTSLGIPACFLHPTEALHGDLGTIKQNDMILMVTFSGRTPELLNILPYLPQIPIVVMSSCMEASECLILASRPDGVLLPTPIHESEIASFGHAAPTSSTTVTMVLGDALALVTAQKAHTTPGRSPAEVFLSNHPGGAIGQAFASKSQNIEAIATIIDEIPIVVPRENTTLMVLDVILTAVRSPSGWVRLSPTHVISPRKIRMLHNIDEPIDPLHSKHLVVEMSDWISILGSWTVTETKQWIAKMRIESRGRAFLKQGTILGVVDGNQQVSSVLEIEAVPGLHLDDHE